MLKTASKASNIRWRLGAWSALAAVELLTLQFSPRLPDVWDVWPVIGVANAIIKIGVLSLAIFALISWPKRKEILRELSNTGDDIHTIAAATVSISAVLLALVIRGYLAANPGTGTDTALASFAYAGAILTGVTALLFVAAPMPFWRFVMNHCRLEFILALVFGVFGLLVGEFLNRARGSFFSEEAWAELSHATLQLSYWIAKTLDSGTFMDESTRVLGAGNFSVQIFAACSGYEGMILISVFLIGYVLLFRKSLRFPNVLVLFPLAMAAIWILNSVRIALLVLLGAHVSPDIALGGFHSQFGWISFLLIAITIMTIAQRIEFFGVTAHSASAANAARPSARAAESNPTVLYLAPFIALMAAQILTRVAAPQDYLLYPLKVFAVLGILVALRNLYARFSWSPAMSSILIGALAGAVWIATDPGADSQSTLATSLAEFTPAALAAWLVFRGIGTIITVPIAEELAFRGYLYRALISSRFEAVDFRTFRIISLIASSVLFGLMHDRWLAAALAGALYALIMIRRGKIEDAIAAHMTTNAVIFAWAIAAGQWSLL
jgi:exosortase E/protease (VPEID-CTERM system)